jgi:hypothetical protein
MERIESLLAAIVGHAEPEWTEKQPLNDAAKAVVAAAVAAAKPDIEKRLALRAQGREILAKLSEVDAAIAEAKGRFMDALIAVQPELANRCLKINEDDGTYQTHDHGPKPEAPKPPEWVNEYLNPKKGNGNG